MLGNILFGWISFKDLLLVRGVVGKV